MNQRTKNNLDSFYAQISQDDKTLYSEIIDFLLALGYTPKKQAVNDLMFSFTHPKTKKVIAKIGIRNGKVSFAIKFFGCKTC